MDISFSSPLLGAPVTLGNLAIWLGLACALTCVALYWTAMIRAVRRAAPLEAEATGASGGKKHGAGNGGRQKEARSPYEERTERIGLWARRFFYATCACGVVGALSLWTLVLSQQYTVQYVWKNSNPELPFGYRFASFWADQEGTFLLWILYNTVLGSVLLRRAREDERWVMPFFTLINVSLFALLAFMNPFWLPAAEEVRGKLMEVGATPDKITFLPEKHELWRNLAYYFGWGSYVHPKFLKAKGLNESLQNFWMVIHPPTLFVGYSSMIVPSCFALGALMRRDYDGWIHRAQSWLAFSWVVLGTGIFLGAYWAYETLGWGGYWSWDPVENSSIIPWVVGTALIHGMLAQRARGNFKQANLFLGLMAGTVVLLSSFLVRSGVLSETSVHSFASPQKSVFNTLLGMLALWFTMSVGIWIWRYKDIQSEIAYEHTWERHFGFFLGLITLSATAIVIMFGVTLPVWKPWLPLIGGKANVDFTFYNKALLPVMFVTVLLMALTPLMPWRRSREGRALKPFSVAALVLSALVSVFFGFAAVWAWQGGFRTQNDMAYLAFGLMLALAVVTNLVVLARAAKGGLLNTAQWVAHLGFIILLGGVVITSRFNTTHLVEKLDTGDSVQVLGRTWTYRGQRKAANDADRDRMLIDMTVNGKTTALAPKLFISRQEGKPMAWPQILNEWFGGAWGDIYVEPSGVDTSGAVSFKEMRKDAEPGKAIVQHRRKDPQDMVLLSFQSLDLAEMRKTMQDKSQQGKPFTVWASVLLNVNGEEKPLRLGLKLDPSQAEPQPEPIPVRVPGLHQPTAYWLRFTDTNMEPANLNANFEMVPEEPVNQAFFQVLHVPGIQVLWFGCYIMIAGGIMTFLRRRGLAQRPVPPPAGPKAPEVRTPDPEAVAELERELVSAE